MNREDFRLGEEDRRVRELGERRQETEVESMGFLRGFSLCVGKGVLVGLGNNTGGRTLQTRIEEKGSLEEHN